MKSQNKLLKKQKDRKEFDIITRFQLILFKILIFLVIIHN